MAARKRKMAKVACILLPFSYWLVLPKATRAICTESQRWVRVQVFGD